MSNLNSVLHSSGTATAKSTEFPQTPKPAISSKNIGSKGEITGFSGGPISRVLDRLDGVRITGSNQWVARCPAHEDRTPSLSVKEGTDNDGDKIVLLYCFAGCDWRDIVASIGLEEHDLFDGNSNGYRSKSTYSPRPRPKPKAKASKPAKPQDPGPWSETARYVYRNESGEALYSKIREASPAGGKRFRRSPAGVPSSLFGLEKLGDATGKILYVSESEKDADRIMGLGGHAVSTGGSKTWKEGLAPRFAEAIAKVGPRFVAILPHHDDPGRAFAEKALQTLESHDVRTVIVNVQKRDSPEGYDVADWFEDGGNLEELDRMSHLVLLREDPIALNATSDDYQCTAPRWIGHRHKRTRYVRSLAGRCRFCFPCKQFFRLKRLSRLLDGLSRWVRVVLVETQTPAQYGALKRRLQRQRATYVSVPLVAGGRIVLTEAAIEGEALDSEETVLRQRLEAILSGAKDTGRARIDGSRNWERLETGPRAVRESEWERLGETKLSPSEQAEVFRAFNCPQIKVLEHGRRDGVLMWGTKHLSDDDFEKLCWSLGFRSRFMEMAA